MSIGNKKHQSKTIIDTISNQIVSSSTIEKNIIDNNPLEIRKDEFFKIILKKLSSYFAIISQTGIYIISLGILYN